MKIRWPGFDAKLVARIEEGLKQADETSIITVTERDNGLAVQYALGGVGRPWTRPMFEVLASGASSTLPRAYKPCPACDDWSRTARCDDHPDNLSVDDSLRTPAHRAALNLLATYNRTPPLSAALESLRNRYVYGFEAGQRGVPVWTIDTGA